MPANALEAAADVGLSAQRLIALAPEYRELLMEGVRDLWSAEREVVATHDQVVNAKRRLNDADQAAVWAKRRRDQIRRDLSALLPELEAIQQGH